MKKQFTEKLIPSEKLLLLAKTLKLQKKTIAVAYGEWDILDPHQMRLLERAKSSADKLIVILFSNESIKDLRGNGHPIFDEMVRAEMLFYFNYIDYITIYPQHDFSKILTKIEPDFTVEQINSDNSDLIMQRVVSSKLGSIFKHYSRLRKKPLAEN